MQKTNRTNITRRGPKASPGIGAAARPTTIELLWDRYQARLIEKRVASAMSRRAEAEGTDEDIERAEAAYGEVYDGLWDIERAIQRTRPVGSTDLAILAQAIIQREQDLGGPSTEDEIKNFCREVQIAAGFATVSKRLIGTRNQIAKRDRKARKTTGNQFPVGRRRRSAA